jgi:hypothetical protein
MSGREPILPDPLTSARGVAAKIVALPPDERPKALEQAKTTFYEAAKLADRTDDEAQFFANRMREVVEDAIQRVAEPRRKLPRAP